MKTNIRNLCERRNTPKVDIPEIENLVCVYGKASTRENRNNQKFKEMKIQILVEKGNKRNKKIEGSSGKSINQIDNSSKGIILKLYG